MRDIVKDMVENMDLYNADTTPTNLISAHGEIAQALVTAEKFLLFINRLESGEVRRSVDEHNCVVVLL